MEDEELCLCQVPCVGKISLIAIDTWLKKSLLAVMAIPQSSSKNWSPSLLLVAAFTLIFSVSCEEHKELNTEADGLNIQLEQLQREETAIEDEMKIAVSAIASAQNNTLVRRAGATIDQKRQTLTSEVEALRERKEELQKDMEYLKNQESSYRQKYL